ncbi:MAG: flagellar motor switch protein FliG [Chromatiales bacterium]|nr:flagellar motor switch protein FliG [Chromatiales bacterium]
MPDTTTSEATALAVPGIERAAILLMALGEKHAAEILRHMGPKEVQGVGQAMAGLYNISSDMVEHVVGVFVDQIRKQTALGVDADDYIRNVLNTALGEDKAGGVIDRILLGRNSRGLDQLKWMDPRAIAELIRNEHPQIMAIVLSILESDVAAQVLAEFGERVRHDVIMRVATLDSIQPDALQELNDIMESQFAKNANVKTAQIGGIKTAADILNLVEGSIESAVMEQIKELDEDLGQQIQDKMFVFENLIGVDDRGIQALLREVASDQLLLALKGADEELKEKIFRNMSKRAAEMMRDDLEAAPPAKLSDVESAQKEILTTARRLADSGEISLGGGGEELV